MISCVSIEGGNYETQAIFIQYNLKAVYSVPYNRVGIRLWAKKIKESVILLLVLREK